ncbi:DUF1674 domain-containing protein [Jannaschia formosa]|nr:DUF1674 domain-containing protein [Jannaschia formosa]
MNVDPSELPQASAEAPACPTENRRPEAEILPLTPEEESARRAALPEAARRALEEADARRAAAASPDLPLELGGRKGPEPVRYGDWEAKGLAIDF